MKKAFTPIITIIIFLAFPLLFTFVWYQFEMHQSSNNIVVNSFEELQMMCVDEVRHINGVINFESAVKFQTE